MAHDNIPGAKPGCDGAAALIQTPPFADDVLRQSEETKGCCPRYAPTAGPGGEMKATEYAGLGYCALSERNGQS